VSWLRRHTEYITSEFEPTSKKVSHAESIESRVGQAALKRAAAEKRKRTNEEIVDAIEHGFERAKATPVHPTDPSLKPVEVLPVFPNFDLWTNRYTLVTFDTNPGRPSGQKRALLKGFSTESEEESGVERQSFVAYLVPAEKGDAENDKGKEKLDDDGDGGDQAAPVVGKAEEYEWVREYVFRKDPQHSATYCFLWDDKSVCYNKIHTKIILDKIKSQALKEVISRQKRPAHTYVTTREPSDDAD